MDYITFIACNYMKTMTHYLLFAILKASYNVLIVRAGVRAGRPPCALSAWSVDLKKTDCCYKYALFNVTNTFVP